MKEYIYNIVKPTENIPLKEIKYNQIFCPSLNFTHFKNEVIAPISVKCAKSKYHLIVYDAKCANLRPHESLIFEVATADLTDHLNWLGSTNAPKMDHARISDFTIVRYIQCGDVGCII